MAPIGLSGESFLPLLLGFGGNESFTDADLDDIAFAATSRVVAPTRDTALAVPAIVGLELGDEETDEHVSGLAAPVPPGRHAMSGGPDSSSSVRR